MVGESGEEKRPGGGPGLFTRAGRLNLFSAKQLFLFIGQTRVGGVRVSIKGIERVLTPDGGKNEASILSIASPTVAAPRAWQPQM